LSSAANLAALVRHFAGFGVHALITGENSTSPFLRRAVRSSMGTIFHLPIVELASFHTSDITHHASRITHQSSAPSTLLEVLRHLRSREIHCIAAHPHATAKNLAQAGFQRDCCILFGSEGYGISQSLLDHCNEAVAIPMAPDVDSLNVAAAAAVFLYEVQRQRG